ncbi:hypothetical protein [Scytonema sp. NUACC26]|uniref:hypothetical protein n=1 Tax=Scytonema sp. NUACC26 TaxID=3140176 RepID=UPI0034DC4796
MPHKQYTEVTKDVNKLQKERKIDYANTQAYAVAIVWSNEAIHGMNQWLSTTHLNFLREEYETVEERMPCQGNCLRNFSVRNARRAVAHCPTPRLLTFQLST